MKKQSTSFTNCEYKNFCFLHTVTFHLGNSFLLHQQLNFFFIRTVVKDHKPEDFMKIKYSRRHVLVLKNYVLDFAQVKHITCFYL